MSNLIDRNKWLEFIATDAWRILLYVLLILLCVLFAPEEPLKFIYTEF